MSEGQRIGQDLDAARDRLREQAQGRPTFLTVDEVAALAHCNHKSVRNAIHEGALTAYRVNGRRLLIEQPDAIAWVKSEPVLGAPRPPAPRPSRPPRTKRVQPGSVQQLREIERKLTRN